MAIPENKLEAFATWMQERGRSEGTASLYVTNLRTCDADPKGLTHRLIAGGLAPNTLRSNIAALRAWARYTKDEELRTRLADMRLPPARRLRTKEPLATELLKKLVRHIQDRRMRNEAVRQVLIIMALRGMRVGDVLRLSRLEVVRAVKTGKLPFEGKGRKRTEFDATPILEPLKALADRAGWDRVRDLVSTSANPNIARKKVWRAARRVASEVGIDEMNPHRFRHTFATRYLEKLAGDPNAIVKLQRFMGWESMATAARYVDAVSQDDLDRIGQGLVSGLLD